MTSVGLKEFLTCLRAQYAPGTSTSTGRVRGTLAAILNGAMVPARKAYDVYVVRLARITPLEQLLGSSDALTPLGWKQVSTFGTLHCVNCELHGRSVGSLGT